MQRLRWTHGSCFGALPQRLWPSGGCDPAVMHLQDSIRSLHVSELPEQTKIPGNSRHYTFQGSTDDGDGRGQEATLLEL